MSDVSLAAFPLGKSVAYRPGSWMIKFPSLSTVYLVARGGVLLPITNGDVANQLYGANWNSRIDVISESFYSNFTIGGGINSRSQFNPETEGNTTLEANFNY